MFRNGSNQALRIPREFELEGKKAIIRCEDFRLIIEPIKTHSVLELLSTWEALAENDALPKIIDLSIESENIF